MNNIKKHIKENQFKKVYLLYGEESYLKRLYKNKLKAAVLAEDDTMNYTYADGKDIDEKEIMHIADTMPFFADHRLIIIENSGWFKSTCEFAAYLKNMPDTTCIVFVENEVDKRNRLYKVVKDFGYISEMNGLDEKNLKLWVASILSKEQKKITDVTLGYFLSKVGTNMDNIESELQKLIGYCLEKDVITNADIDAVCSEQITGKMFVMLDAIATKNQKRALELYYDLLTLREKPMTILYLLNRHINLLLQTKDMLKDQVDIATIASRLSVPPFAVNKYAQQSKNFSSNMLYQALTLGTELEEGVKVGRLVDQIAVELMIVQTVML